MKLQVSISNLMKVLCSYNGKLKDIFLRFHLVKWDVIVL